MFYTIPTPIDQFIKEAALPMNTSHDALRGHLRTAIRTAHGVTGDMWSSDGPWVNDVFPGHVVYQHKGETFKRSYKVTQGAAGTDPTVTLGTHKKVHVAYVDSAQESLKSTVAILSLTPKEGWVEDSIKICKEMGVTVTYEDGSIQVLESGEAVLCMTTEEFTAVKESTKPQIVPVKIIAPGWGSMAYYSKEVLARDGPTVFTKGTHMMWNHPTATEEADRPEGDLSDLAAVLTENAKWNETGPKGPGLYAKAKVFSDYAQQVSEKGAHIGISINAGVKAHEGEAEGRQGRIADQFVKAYSVDFVTKAGAGGAPIVPAMESDRRINSPGKETDNMTDLEKIKDLEIKLGESQAKVKTLESENSSLKEAQYQFLAVSAIGTVLREAGIKFNAQLLHRACANPVVKEAKLDSDWVKTVVGEFSDGVKGEVEGVGESRRTNKEEEADDKALESVLAGLGVTKEGMSAAVKGGR